MPEIIAEAPERWAAEDLILSGELGDEGFVEGSMLFWDDRGRICYERTRRHLSLSSTNRHVLKVVLEIMEPCHPYRP
jgi:hypothetical protein